jgi:hypothetical protein
MTPSQRLDSPLSIFDSEFCAWCVAVILLWRTDPFLELEFPSIVHFFDFANEATDDLIRSVQI